MAKTRVHELAKEFGVESKFVLEKLKEMGEFVKSASSTVEPPVEMRFKKQFGEELKAAGAKCYIFRCGYQSTRAKVPRQIVKTCRLVLLTKLCHVVMDKTGRHGKVTLIGD